MSGAEHCVERKGVDTNVDEPTMDHCEHDSYAPCHECANARATMKARSENEDGTGAESGDESQVEETANKGCEVDDSPVHTGRTVQRSMRHIEEKRTVHDAQKLRGHGNRGDTVVCFHLPLLFGGKIGRIEGLECCLSNGR